MTTGCTASATPRAIGSSPGALVDRSQDADQDRARNDERQSGDDEPGPAGALTPDVHGQLGGRRPGNQVCHAEQVEEPLRA